VRDCSISWCFTWSKKILIATDGYGVERGRAEEETVPFGAKGILINMACDSVLGRIQATRIWRRSHLRDKSGISSP
jgi:hypothetical protein